MLVDKKETRVWLQISQNIKRYNTTDFSAWYSIIILYFHSVHCSFIYGHGWLHINQFVKHVKIVFVHFSWRCLRCMMAFAGAFTTKEQFMHPHCIVNLSLGRRQFWPCFTWLLHAIFEQNWTDFWMIPFWKRRFKYGVRSYFWCNSVFFSWLMKCVGFLFE